MAWLLLSGLALTAGPDIHDNIDSGSILRRDTVLQGKYMLGHRII